MPWNWVLITQDTTLTFGDDDALIVVQEWSVEPGKLRVEDRERPRSDGLIFGQDLRSGQVVTFTMWVNGRNEDGAILGLSELQRAWRNDSGRSVGGAMCMLQHPRGRFVFGRPRGLVPNTRRVERGWATASADFECVDDLWYGPEEQTTIRFVPPVSGGLTFPAEAPFTFDSGPAVRNASVQVTGDVSTWPVFEIKGPVTNPEVDIVGVGKLIFSVDLAYDQTLRVDTRPWARWVKRDGAAFPGALSSAGARLSDVSLPPGTYQVLLRGYDPTGTAELRVSTWPAFTSF